MIDALGRPQSVLLIGGTSEIGLAVVRALPAERLQRVVLLGRDADGLKHASEQVRAPRVDVVLTDADDLAGHERAIAQAFDDGDVDVTILAMGALGDQAAAADDPAAALATVQATYTGPLSLLLHAGRRLRAQGHGEVIVLSSVAGRQARKGNWQYGSAKAGLDLAALGLGDDLAAVGGKVLVVRPGFVRTRMTAGRPVAPLAVDADDVARAAVAALRRRRTVVYVPAPMRAVAAVLGVLPRRVLRRLPF